MEVVHRPTDNDHLTVNNHHMVHHTVNNNLLMVKDLVNKILTVNKAMVNVHHTVNKAMVNDHHTVNKAMVNNLVSDRCPTGLREKVPQMAVRFRHHSKVVLVAVVVRQLYADHLV
jgi:hypothetical protein